MSDEIENISSFNDNELNTAYIPKGMKIVGNVNSDGNLSLAGEVEGNVSIAGNLELNGKVKGDSISVGRTELTEGTIWSNIECADYIKIGKGVSVVGNITADKADIEGAVLGDIDVKNKVYIGKEAVVKGDLVAGEDGTIRAIGLSNFLPHHLENIFSFCNIAPVADQLELHLGYMQERTINYAGEHDLRLQAWSPLGRGNVLNDKRFTTMAEKYGVTVSQLALNFLYRYGIIPLPKSAGAERQRQNLDIFGFTISEEDFSFLACLPNTLWSGEHPDFAIPALKSNIHQ